MFEASVYENRRQTLCTKLASGVILLLGNEEVGMNYADNTYDYRQDSTFLYYFGHSLPGLAALIDVESREAVLYGNDPSIDDIVWTGPLPSIRQLAEQVGLKKSGSLAQLQDDVRAAVAAGRKVHFLPTSRYYNAMLMSSLLGLAPEEVAEEISGRDPQHVSGDHDPKENPGRALAPNPEDAERSIDETDAHRGI